MITSADDVNELFSFIQIIQRDLSYPNNNFEFNRCVVYSMDTDRIRLI